MNSQSGYVIESLLYYVDRETLASWLSDQTPSEVNGYWVVWCWDPQKNRESYVDFMFKDGYADKAREIAKAFCELCSRAGILVFVTLNEKVGEVESHPKGQPCDD